MWFVVTHNLTMNERLIREALYEDSDHIQDRSATLFTYKEYTHDYVVTQHNLTACLQSVTTTHSRATTLFAATARVKNHMCLSSCTLQHSRTAVTPFLLAQENTQHFQSHIFFFEKNMFRQGRLSRSVKGPQSTMPVCLS